MAAVDFEQLLTSEHLIPVATFLGGFAVANVIGLLRNRVRTLTYTVTHNRIGLSADDQIFGVVKVSWQNVELNNLWMSTAALENQSTRDYTKFEIVAYTGPDTKLLTAIAKIINTPNALIHTDAFANAVAVPAGAQPTAQQWEFWSHRREYKVPVLNRGQRIELTYLTTVLPPAPSPTVLLDIVHEGVRLEYQPNVPLTHGVPLKKAAGAGLVACIGIVLLAGFLVSQPWLAALIGAVAGVFGQTLGAYCYKVYRLAKDLTVR
jgi:hypothetical protein